MEIFMNIILILGAIILFVAKVLIPIIKDIKEYKKLPSDKKDKIKILGFIFFFPIVLIILDETNVFSFLFPGYKNLTRDYDWLSFVGTYSGAIISAILLIFITKKDRDENTEVIRYSQRPYLDVSYMRIEKIFFNENNDKVIILDHGTIQEKRKIKDKYLTVCIKNNGATVAIIDINKTKIKVCCNDSVGIEKSMNLAVNRLSIKSGEELYIRFFDERLYNGTSLAVESKIISSIIYYKDLFNKNYVDECELSDTLHVLQDNKEID